ncbi:MAG TPA: transcriptional repressor [Oscillospiraceae bacterium]|nr:transcriptional repressor [Oscillospiraceae bacterium]
MSTDYEKASSVLVKNGIKPSHQRVMIYFYLESNLIHPTALQIYEALKESIPTLSKSTVYSTLKAFLKANIVREITIGENEIRYEFNVHDHGHFRCNRCGTIYDFEISRDCIHTDELLGFKIDDKNVYYKGICKCCLEKEA